MFHFHLSHSRLFIIACALILSACHSLSRGPGGSSIPSAQQTPGPLPHELDKARQAEKMLAFSSKADARPFVSWASQAPVTRRSEIRKRLSEETRNDDIAEALIEDFKLSELSDHSRALVILSLLGELKNERGTKFLTTYVWEALPQNGTPMKESGVSIERYNKEILQSKAVAGLAYLRDPAVNQNILEVVAKHSSNAVRAEAVAAYLWNNKASENVKNSLRQYVRPEEKILIDRPIRTSDMSAAEFNRELSDYLEKHPELAPPAPKKRKPGNGGHDHGEYR
jgi:hypothetical protein